MRLTAEEVDRAKAIVGQVLKKVDYNGGFCELIDKGGEKEVYCSITAVVRKAEKKTREKTRERCGRIVESCNQCPNRYMLSGGA